MRMVYARLLRAATIAGALVAMIPPAAMAQQTLSGRVTDKESGKGIQGAKVVIVGTNTLGTTNAEGRYTLRAGATGIVPVRAFAVGYLAQSRDMDLGGTPNGDFALSPSVVRLDEIVTTATGDQRRLELGSTVGTVQADSVVNRSPISNITDVLNSRVAGVSVQTQTGTLGGGSRVRIRGANSISLSNEPILLVDGVRANNQAVAGSIGVGGQATSRFNDINPDDIESIEVIKGPSAATLYGTEAANGVISIKTKRGRAGSTVWSAYADGGLIQDKNPYPANFNAYGNQGGSSQPFCFLFSVATGDCTTQDSVVQFNTLRNPLTSPLVTGHHSQLGLNVSGGNERLRYYLGGDFTREDGVYTIPQHEVDSVKAARGITQIPSQQLNPNTTRRVSFRSSVTASVAKNVEVDATIGYVQNRQRLPQNDNNLFGLLSNALLGSAVDPQARWGFGIGPAASFSHTDEQLINRITGSVTTRWLPSSALSGRLVVGLDQTSESDVDFGRVGEAPAVGDDARGTRSLNKFTIGLYSADASLAAQKNLTKTVGSKTTLGAQYYRTTINGALATGNGIASGSNTIGGATQLIASSQSTAVANGGVYLEEVLSWKDRLFVTGAVRLDQASAFARTTGAALLPKAGISYIVFNGREGTLNLLRLRGSYGSSLVAPDALVRLRTYQPVTGVAPGGVNVAAVTFGNLGNPDLRPERSREFEAGVDASFFADRLSVELSAYDKLTKDALVNRVLAPSLGVAGSQFYNIGSMKNQGIELGINAEVLRGKTVSASLSLVGSLLKNRLLSLGAGIEPFPVGFTQRMVPGYPAGGFWDRKVTFNDANHDGLLAPDEITVGDTAVFIGGVLPTREVSLTPEVRFWSGKLRISSQFNYRGGAYLDNTTHNFRCQALANCQGLYDKSVPIAEQAYASGVLLNGGKVNGDVQKSDFLRLREMSITYTASRKVASLFRASTASVTLAGRNLAVWTKYNGIDPETSAFGAANFGTSDFLTQPPLRFYTLRINLGF